VQLTWQANSLKLNKKRKGNVEEESSVKIVMKEKETTEK